MIEQTFFKEMTTDINIIYLFNDIWRNYMKLSKEHREQFFLDLSLETTHCL
jgi:hypothetical protein